MVAEYYYYATQLRASMDYYGLTTVDWWTTYM